MKSHCCLLAMIPGLFLVREFFVGLHTMYQAPWKLEQKRKERSSSWNSSLGNEQWPSPVDRLVEGHSINSRAQLLALVCTAGPWSNIPFFVQVKSSIWTVNLPFKKLSGWIAILPSLKMCLLKSTTSHKQARNQQEHRVNLPAGGRAGPSCTGFRPVLPKGHPPV